MQLTVSRREIKIAVHGLGRVVSRKSTLPVLQNVRLSCDGNKVTAAGTDLDAELVFLFKDAVSDGKGVALIPFVELTNLTKGSDADAITIKTSGEVIEITNAVAGQSLVRRVNCIHPSEWPVLKSDVEVNSVDPAFLSHVRHVAPFASTDTSRYILNGVFLDIGKDGDYLVCTDGRRLTAFNTLKFPIKQSCVVPASKFLTWGKLEREQLSIGYADKNGAGWFRLVTPQFDYRVRTIDGTYPNWRQVVPAKPGKFSMVIGDEDQELLSKVLPTFAGHASVNATITLRGVRGKIVVTGRGDDDPSPSTLELPNSKMDNADISVNRDYLLDALAVGFRSFTFEDNMSPLCARDKNGGVHVLMPQRSTVPARASTKAAAPAPQPTETKEKPMPKISEASAAPQEGNALERVLAAYEQAKTKVREANDALAAIAVAVKDALREDKQRRAEIGSVRAGLARLQSIKV